MRPLSVLPNSWIPWHALGCQLRHPSGLAGRALGVLMRRVNALPNRAALAALDPRPGETVLELGCGPGHGLSLALAAVGLTGVVHGIDQSADMLDQARQRNAPAAHAGSLHLHLGRFDALPLASASIDRVLAVNVAYFWQDAPSVLREVRRVLRPGGRLVIYVTDAATMRRWPFALTGTHRLFTPASLGAMLVSGGFSSAEVSVRSLVFTPARWGGGVTGLIATARHQPEPSLQAAMGQSMTTGSPFTGGQPWPSVPSPAGVS